MIRLKECHTRQGLSKAIRVGRDCVTGVSARTKRFRKDRDFKENIVR